MPGKNRKKRLITIDAETDPFEYGANIEPFIWCAYDGQDYEICENTADFLLWCCEQNAYIYAHNGGKFDFHFLLREISHLWDMAIDEIPVRVINGRIAEIKIRYAVFRDSVSILPIALADYQKTEFDYSKLEKKVRHKHWQEIVRYIKDDCFNLFELVSRFRQEAGKAITIASNAFAFAKHLEIETGRTHYHFDSDLRPFYFGGRCEARKAGHFHSVHVMDIKSAYPFAMEHRHATGMRYTDVGPYWTTLTKSQMQRAFFILECFSHGAFPVRENHGLTFPERRDVYHVTGWELVTALEHRLVSDLVVHHCYTFDESISFEQYTKTWFQKKAEAEAQGDKAQRMIAKIMLNSLYGKLAQNPLRYGTYKITRPGDEPDDGFEVKEWGELFDIHVKPMETRLLELYGYEDDGSPAWKRKPLYYNVATAASITGFTRSMLVDAMARIGRDAVLYMDTDSLITLPHARIEALDQSGAIGSWEYKGQASNFWCAGKKLYALEYPDGEREVASKGVRLSLEQVAHIVETGEPVQWANDAPTFSLTGEARYISREIKPTMLDT